MVIHKYKIEPPRNGTTVIVEMPSGAEILSAQVQQDQVFVWAEVDSKQPKEGRAFEVLPTGYEYEDTLMLAFIGTVQLGPLVFHIFENLAETTAGYDFS